MYLPPRTSFPVLLVMAISVLGGCETTSSVKVSNQRFLIPETGGNWGQNRVSAAYGSKSRITLAHDLEEAQVDVDHPTITHDDGIMIMGEMGIAENIDAFINTSNGIGFNYQFLGASRKNAEPGNLSASVSLAYDQFTYLSSPKKDYRPEGRQVKSEITTDVKSWDLAVTGGYRLRQVDMVYASLGYIPYQASGVIRRYVDENSPERWSLKHRAGHVINLLGGYHWSMEDLFVQLEAGFARTTYDLADDDTRFVVGALVGLMLR